MNIYTKIYLFFPNDFHWEISRKCQTSTFNNWFIPFGIISTFASGTHSEGLNIQQKTLYLNCPFSIPDVSALEKRNVLENVMMFPSNPMFTYVR